MLNRPPTLSCAKRPEGTWVEMTVSDVSADPMVDALNVEVNAADVRWAEAGITPDSVQRIGQTAWDAVPWEDEADETALPLNTEFGLSVLLTDDPAVRALNASFRNIDKATNVLSFPASDDTHADEPGGGRHLGDIALAYETVEREAQDNARPMRHHAAHLIVHGLLHVLGYDHETDDDAETMERLETHILAALDIPDPYIGTEPLDRIGD